MSGPLPAVEKMPSNVRAYLEPRLAALAAQYDGVPPEEALPAIAREAPPHVARYLLDYLAHFYMVYSPGREDEDIMVSWHQE